ncbi:DUF4344 domain-containing metallopeptidase (plasmid) [Microbulbifer sp. SSSA002]|uniref:DUF4344 domain-containing metallopeptidase n=1 Tax=Microbulbifer sp. SSSA002 TaxID=3243376 RepID=UPI0040399BB7
MGREHGRGSPQFYLFTWFGYPEGLGFNQNDFHTRVSFRIYRETLSRFSCAASFGQEEDAADVLSVMMIDWLYEEEAAQELAFNSAFGYINDPDGVEEVAWWDLHGPDQQRYYNHICLFYGADPEKREDLAYDLGLPEDRAQMCPVEYEQAANSWGAVFDEMSPESGVPLVFQKGSGKEAELINQVLSDEVKNLEQDMSLPSEVIVKVDSCGEPNAFYDPEEASIIFCTEFIPHLRSLYQANLEN